MWTNSATEFGNRNVLECVPLPSNLCILSKSLWFFMLSRESGRHFEIMCLDFICYWDIICLMDFKDFRFFAARCCLCMTQCTIKSTDETTITTCHWWCPKCCKKKKKEYWQTWWLLKKKFSVTRNTDSSFVSVSGCFSNNNSWFKF